MKANARHALSSNQSPRNALSRSIACPRRIPSHSIRHAAIKFTILYRIAGNGESANFLPMRPRGTKHLRKLKSAKVDSCGDVASPGHSCQLVSIRCYNPKLNETE